MWALEFWIQTNKSVYLHIQNLWTRRINNKCFLQKVTQVTSIHISLTKANHRPWLTSRGWKSSITLYFQRRSQLTIGESCWCSLLIPFSHSLISPSLEQFFSKDMARLSSNQHVVLIMWLRYILPTHPTAPAPPHHTPPPHREIEVYASSPWNWEGLWLQDESPCVTSEARPLRTSTWFSLGQLILKFNNYAEGKPKQLVESPVSGLTVRIDPTHVSDLVFGQLQPTTTESPPDILDSSKLRPQRSQGGHKQYPQNLGA